MKTTPFEMVFIIHECMMRKKRIAAIICLVVCLLAVPAKAYHSNTNTETDQLAIMPRMTFINNADCYFSIQNKAASVNAYVNGIPSAATKCEIVVELQEKSLFFWSTIATWSDSQYAYRASVNESIGVTAGKSYRAVTTVTVWSGSESESRTLTSATIVA